MTYPEFDFGATVWTETDLAQRAIKDVLARTKNPEHIAIKHLTFLRGPLGTTLAALTLECLRKDPRIINSGEITLPNEPYFPMKRELIRGWETFYFLPPEEQQKMREAAQEEFLSTKK